MRARSNATSRVASGSGSVTLCGGIPITNKQAIIWNPQGKRKCGGSRQNWRRTVVHLYDVDRSEMCSSRLYVMEDHYGRPLPYLGDTRLQVKPGRATLALQVQRDNPEIRGIRGKHRAQERQNNHHDWFHESK